MQTVIIRWELLSHSLLEDVKHCDFMRFVESNGLAHFGVLNPSNKEQSIWDFIREHDIVLDQVKPYVGTVTNGKLHKTEKLWVLKQLRGEYSSNDDTTEVPVVPLQ